MKTLLLAGAAALAALVATPAVAQTNAGFTGIRVEANAGLTDFVHSRDINDVTYGLAVGADVPVGDRVTLGAEATASNVFDSTGRTFGAGARLGYAVSPRALLFARAGYTNIDAFHGNLDGIAVGGGAEFKLNPATYVSAQYRYTNYEKGVGSHGALIGFGFRFK